MAPTPAAEMARSRHDVVLIEVSHSRLLSCRRDVLDSCRYFGVAAALDTSQQHENKNDDQDDSYRARGAIAPPGAVRPARKRAQQDQDENDEKNGAEHLNNSQTMIPDSL